MLFDMDGTLVDSEKVWDVGLFELAERLGGRLSADARGRMVGTSMSQSMTILHDDLGITDADARANVAWLERRVQELFANGLDWRGGARELLAEVRAAGVPTALVTATRRDLVDVALDTLGRENFTVVVCGDEVEITKPHPEPYLAAARLLDVSTDRCVAIEDSPTGVASAIAAGCAVLAVPSEVSLDGVTGATIVDSLAGVHLTDLEALLRS